MKRARSIALLLTDSETFLGNAVLIALAACAIYLWTR